MRLVLDYIFTHATTVSMNSPFSSYKDKSLPRNYAEIFDPKDYECKDSLELESYAHNLRNYLLGLLAQKPFPEFLFNKLEKRLDGITSILQSRSSASGVLNKEQATKRMEVLSQRLDGAPATSTSTRIDLVSSRPAKKRKIEPVYVNDVKKSMEALRSLKKSYSDSESTLTVEEEED